MAHDRRIQKNIILVIAALFIILLIVDRYYWAQIAQWREDQATNLWLGYTAGLTNIPVGLISSEAIPNPNGMILLGSILSLLPGLLSVSFFLGFLQIIVLGLIGWKSARGEGQYFLLAALPPLCSVILRSISVEFWNQYTITLVNIFFLFWTLRYLEKPTVRTLVPIAILTLLAPSLYLAGIVNAAVMFLIMLGIIVYRRPAFGRELWFAAGIILSIALLSFLLTWLPFFRNISLDQLADYNNNNPGPVASFQTIWESLFGLPIYGTFQWADQAIFPLAFKHADEKILTQGSSILLRLVGSAYLLQAVFAFAAFSYTVFHLLRRVLSGTDPGITVHRPALRLAILSMLFINLALAIDTWLGGPDWLHGERPDQIVQLLPMFLFFIFLLPRVIRLEGRMGDTIIGVSHFSLGLFTLVNLVGGFFIIRDHLQYRGPVLTEADVPLINKVQVVNFIAEDWRNYSDSTIVPVDYDLGGNRWDWVPHYGRKLTKWYPSPMTDGRALDYELLRRHGLTNQQEGTQIREFGNGRYLVTYAFENFPEAETGRITHIVFGRLRVSILEK